MISNRTLAITLGFVGWGLAYIVAKSHKDAVRRDARLSRKQLTTWEGEGGNLMPPPPAPPVDTALQADAR
ncbi:hypothetical protein QN362_02245 [Actimicrobium sp. CCC2.4]|uniref:hypothetical protein n=1 Tax=Actimicrobium sp. CCC2.4 TaxID=3048606 RepID=UPI002AC89AC7|nr:hypothetical protein [Actimicrobium sp. CCC2.4]MEB0134144.1 hypothetical protein [Actimicrobium sp. CCC2.4]WPX32799.1 hypothetical protein RHM62_02805 [Actimicrobium sp. CCC2.4]